MSKTSRVDAALVKDFLRENDISQTEAARLCGDVNLRTFQRWMIDKPSMPLGMWELLQIKVASGP